MTSDRKYQHLFSQFQFRKTLIWIYACVHAKLLHSCLTLCDAMDYSPPGSSVHGILQARILEWVATLSSRGSSQPRDQSHVSFVSLTLTGGFHLVLPGKPLYTGVEAKEFSVSKKLRLLQIEFCYHFQLAVKRKLHAGTEEKMVFRILRLSKKVRLR